MTDTQSQGWLQQSLPTLYLRFDLGDAETRRREIRRSARPTSGSAWLTRPQRRLTPGGAQIVPPCVRPPGCRIRLV
jgi:hypothetical protein